MELSKTQRFFFCRSVYLVFRGSVLAQNTPEYYPCGPTFEANKDMNNVSCRCDMTETLLKALNPPQILDSSKLKEFADDNFKFDENSSKLS